VKLIIGFVFAIILISNIAFAGPSIDKPKVIVEQAQLSEDLKHVLVPAKVNAKLQSTATADFEAHIVQIVKSLGSKLKQGDVVMYLENRDPSFTYARVPVRSPIDGVLSQLLVTQMSKVARGDKLFTVINPKSIKIDAEFSAVDASLVKVGSEGVFKLNSVAYPIKVLGVSPLIDPRTGTAASEIEIVPSDKSSLPMVGSIGQVEFDISQGKVILVPENALFYSDGKPLVRILNANQLVEKAPVELGEQREELFIVKSGLEAGQKIIVRSSRPIKDGEQIEIEKTEKN
jgi:multidrug efflux pump subunit AcrA (membrane-fusion protein)